MFYDVVLCQSVGIINTVSYTHLDVYKRQVEGGAVLNVTQDDLISTNIDECVDDTTDEITIEMVDGKSSKSDNVDIFNQLTLIMEVMNKNNDNLNTSLNEFKTEIKSEIKSEINVVNNKLDKQDEKKSPKILSKVGSLLIL